MLKQLAKGSLVLGLATAASMVIEYGYQLLMARSLSIGDFGLLNTSLSVYWILATAITYGVGLALPKYISENRDLLETRRLIANGLFLEFALAVGVSATLLVFAQLVLPHTLAADLSAPLTIVALILPLCTLMLTSSHILQGLEWINSMAATFLSNSSIKLVSAAVLVNAGFGLAGALGALLVGGVFTLAWILWVIRDYLRFCRPDVSSMKKIALFSANTTAFAVGFHFLFKSDVVLLKAAGFPNEAVGLYTAVALVARIAYVIGLLSFSVVLLPVVSRNNGITRSQMSNFGLLILSVYFTANLAAYFGSELILKLFFPPAFSAVSHLLPPFVAAMSLLGLSYISATALVAVGKPEKTLKPIAAGILVYLATFAVTARPLQLKAPIVAVLIAAATTLVLTMRQVNRHAVKAELA